MKQFVFGMRVATIILLLLCFICQGRAQSEKLLWPIKGQKAGEGILYRPQDYIGDEFNFANLFITAPEGTQVLCPADAVVENYSYNYYMSLSTSTNYGNSDKPYNEYIAEQKEAFRAKGWNLRCLSIQIGLKIGDRKLWILGLRRNEAIPTGTRLKRGDVLGTLGYSYHAISEPSIMLSVSKDTRSDDPMMPFGLRTTFRKPVPQPTKFHLTREEAVADYLQLTGSIKEIFPSLEDFMTEKEYDAFVGSQIERIPADGIELKNFAKLVGDYNAVIHDSHLSINCPVPDNPKTQTKGANIYFPPLHFGLVGVGDSLNERACVVLVADSVYAKYVGRRIARIDGKSASDLSAISRRKVRYYDANVKSVADYEACYQNFLDYAFEVGPQPQGKTMVYEFEDGERLELPLVRGFMGDEKDRNKFFHQQSLNRHKDSPIGIRQINDSVLYIGISTFSLSQVDCDSVVSAIYAAERNQVPNLIFDVRNNRGGDAGVLERITRALMGLIPDRPHTGYLKVNAALFKSPTLNLVAGDTIFGDFKPVEGRKGLYQMPTEEDKARTPSVDSLGYNGRLYVLTDCGSASASAFLAGTVKRNCRGYIVGRETMSAYHCETCMKFASIELANSKFSAKIPMVRIVIDETVNDRLPALRGVMPDYNIPLTEEEFHYDGDYVLDRTLQLIADGIYIEAPADESSKKFSPYRLSSICYHLPVVHLAILPQQSFSSMKLSSSPQTELYRKEVFVVRK